LVWGRQERISDRLNEIKTGFSNEFIETLDTLEEKVQKIKELINRD
ncbi:unnamed protein product, partial [marine sediment metagenome]